MNISKTLQRTLHALAQGGCIVVARNETGAIVAAQCRTRDGWVLAGCDLAAFKSLKQKRLIASHDGQPYRITREGLANLRSQLDNRVGGKGW